jgi:hypothetical protein
MNESEIASLKSFLACAKRGRHPGASSGERDAHSLADKAEVISALMQGLDGDKQDGFLQLLRGFTRACVREAVSP